MKLIKARPPKTKSAAHASEALPPIAMPFPDYIETNGNTFMRCPERDTDPQVGSTFYWRGAGAWGFHVQLVNGVLTPGADSGLKAETRLTEVTCATYMRDNGKYA